MHKRMAVLLGLTAALMGGAAQVASAAPWTRGFVVGTYEYAFHYGGRASFARTGEIEPGSDCAHGSTVHFSNGSLTRKALSLQPWRSKFELDSIADAPGLEEVRGPVLTRFLIWNRAVAYRGWKKGIETYVNPFAAVDPGQPEVVGKIADGLDLDSNPNTGFTAPDGQKGIDNNLYRAWGCDAPWRGNGNATLDLRANDKMQDGLYTMVIRLSGNQSPMNDSDTTVEVGYSPDKIVKDARGGVAVDYSYRLPKTTQYTRLKAKISNGVMDTEQVSELHMPRVAWFYDHSGDAFFRRGKLRLTLAPDGTLSGIVGGYRDWRDLYSQNTFAQDGGQQGIREHEDAVSLYYALRRNADGMKDPATGQYQGISTAYRITAKPAFVVDPDPDHPVNIRGLAEEEDRKLSYEAITAAMVRATTTRMPQDVPPGTSEAAVPQLETNFVDLPSKGYFLKTLDRPHYVYYQDKEGHISKDMTEVPDLGTPRPIAPQQSKPGQLPRPGA